MEAGIWESVDDVFLEVPLSSFMSSDDNILRMTSLELESARSPGKTRRFHVSLLYRREMRFPKLGSYCFPMRFFHFISSRKTCGTPLPLILFA